jgi:hypothetical protein
VAHATAHLLPSASRATPAPPAGGGKEAAAAAAAGDAGEGGDQPRGAGRRRRQQKRRPGGAGGGEAAGAASAAASAADLLAGEAHDLRRLLQQSQDERLCVICLDRPKAVGVLHWGSVHVCLCSECAGAISIAGGCPVCRQAIEQMLPVY